MNEKKNLPLQSYLLPAYLAIIILVFITFTIQSLIPILLPLAIILVAIHYQKKELGVFGFSLYCILSLSQIKITSLEQIPQIISFLVLIILPSLIVLIQILSQTTPSQTIQDILSQPKAFAVSGIVTACLFFIIYLIPLFIGEGILFSAESIQHQIIFIAAISLLCTTPFLLKKSNAELKTDQ
jgi:glucan phosphoethanolaminetransferase (alkaline phosphatase superfamily)